MLNLIRPLRFNLTKVLGTIRPFPSIATSRYQQYYSTEAGHYEKFKNFKKRNPTKGLFSRKTFLIDYYKHLNDTNEIVLFVHHNNMTKAENKKFRNDLDKLGAKLNIIRTALYKVYLRSEEEADPADKETSLKNKEKVHPAFPLLNGPTGIITIENNDPTVVALVLKVLKSAQEKLILVGAKVEKRTFDIDQVDQFKDLPTKDQLQSQLAGLLSVLSGAGLVQTLSANQTSLYLSLKQSILDRNDGKDLGQEED